MATTRNGTNMSANLTEELRWKFAHDSGVLFPRRTVRRIARKHGAVKVHDTNAPINKGEQRRKNKLARKQRKANRK